MRAAQSTRLMHLHTQVRHCTQRERIQIFYATVAANVAAEHMHSGLLDTIETLSGNPVVPVLYYVFLLCLLYIVCVV